MNKLPLSSESRDVSVRTKRLAPTIWLGFHEVPWAWWDVAQKKLVALPRPGE